MQDDQESTPARSTASNVANNAAKDVSTDAKDIEVETKEEESDVIWEPTPKDILAGRGAKINARPGNKMLRALCFARKPEFDGGNHAMKRRVATEIVTALQKTTGRFLRKDKQANGVWREMSTEEAIQKAMQVIRDYKRPDRVALRGAGGQNGARKRRHCQESTPMDILQNIPPAPLYAIDDNPHKVSESDVLCGRGAFVNGHSGNQRLRDLAIKRKAAFDAGSFTDKQQLASEIVNIIRNLHPPGRFLKRPVKLKGKPLPRGLAGEWEELSDALAIHKACQIMRDINRPDRQERDAKRRLKKMPAATATNNHPGTAVHDGHHSEDMKGVAQMMVRDTLQNQEEMRNSNSNNSNNALGSGEETCSPQQHKKHNTESHISLAEGQHLESITEEALVDQALGI